MTPHPAAEATPELDIAGISDEFARRARRVCGDHADLALDVLTRLDPERWTLEWFVPWWLGNLFALGPRVARQLVLANVLGLASLRIHDDLVDGEAIDERLDAVALALHGEALSVFRELIPLDATFWLAVDRYLGAWYAATDSAAGGAIGDASVAALRGRGAPMKIGVLAACVIGNRTDLVLAIDACMDHALAALALYDDACDWQQDVQAGRWNAFVEALVVSSSGRPHDPEQTRIATLLALATTSICTDYFARLSAEARTAAALAEPLGLGQMSAHLLRFADHACAHGASLERRHHRYASQAAKIVFGSAFIGHPGDAVAPVGHGVGNGRLQEGRE